MKHSELLLADHCTRGAGCAKDWWYSYKSWGIQTGPGQRLQSPATVNTVFSPFNKLQQ